MENKELQNELSAAGDSAAPASYAPRASRGEQEESTVASLPVAEAPAETPAPAPEATPEASSLETALPPVAPRKGKKGLIVGVMVAVLAAIAMVCGLFFAGMFTSSSGPVSVAKEYIAALSKSDSKAMCEFFTGKMLDTTTRKEKDSDSFSREKKIEVCAKVIGKQVTPEKVKELAPTNWNPVERYQGDGQAIVDVKGKNDAQVGVLVMEKEDGNWRIVDPATQSKLLKEHAPADNKDGKKDAVKQDAEKK